MIAKDSTIMFDELTRLFLNNRGQDNDGNEASDVNRLKNNIDSAGFTFSRVIKFDGRDEIGVDSR